MSRDLVVGHIRLATLAAALIALVSAVPASATGSASVVKGQFHTFAAGIGLGLNVRGDAVLVRAPGRTLAVVIAAGLAPVTSYGSHVHKAACAAGDADGHFQFTPGGAADSVNEIWPGFTTNHLGIGIGFAQNAAV